MFLPSSVKIFLASQPADMRKSHHGLSSLVRQHFSEPLISGHLFVFHNKRKNRTKILFYDRGGTVVYYKMLERGRFKFPETSDRKGPIQLNSAQLNALLAGFDFSQLKDQRLWLPYAG
ncbi:MAG: IS66 family insertion sequence element accessory protein TnpB [Planctomycetota bacterium]|nr:IS66 family insertion sequence element accessory protein TnpB [Planctomycetota bacterium]